MEYEFYKQDEGTRAYLSCKLETDEWRDIVSFLSRYQGTTMIPKLYLRLNEQNDWRDFPAGKLYSAAEWCGCAIKQLTLPKLFSYLELIHGD